MRKFLAKLVSWKTRENLSATRFSSDQQDQAKLAREKHQQIMEGRRDKKYVSEMTVPAGEVRRPEDSVAEETHE